MGELPARKLPRKTVTPSWKGRDVDSTILVYVQMTLALCIWHIGSGLALSVFPALIAVAVLLHRHDLTEGA
jgi:hypothetical protein